MTAAPAAATPTPTPEELARTARLRITKELCGFLGFEAEKIIAAAIRQHSEALSAEIERLTEALDDVQTAYCNHVMQQTDANVIAQSVADYGSAEAAVKGLHDFQLRVHQTMIDHFKARATTAEAALADLPRLIAVIGKLTGAPMDDPAGYGLDDCVTLLEEHEDAIAGIGWQIGLTGETERADQAETRAAAASSDASRHERLWRAAMRGMAANKAMHRAALAAMTADRDSWERQASDRVGDAVEAYARAEKAEAALSASLERERRLREALTGLADVMEGDCGVEPCVGSMAPAEHYLGLARAELAKEAADWRPDARKAIIDDARAVGLLNEETANGR